MSKKKIIIGIIVGVVALGVIGSLSSPEGQDGLRDGLSTASATPVATAESSTEPTTEATPTPEPSPTADPTAAPTASPEAFTPNAEEPAPDLTASQENAIDQAISYLSYSAFSRSGLIDQLKFEGYSKADAKFAVDSLDVDWKEQAYEKALEYLDYSSFSRKALIEQLEFEGFTNEQAEYGATKAYE